MIIVSGMLLRLLQSEDQRLAHQVGIVDGRFDDTTQCE